MDKTIFDELIKTLQPYKDKLDDYSLVITGTVGAGKSTRCEALNHVFTSAGIPTTIYPEYITVDNAISQRMLEKKMNKEISSNTLQSFILDNWEKLLINSSEKRGLSIYERCVDDSFVCFCNIENKNNAITENELLSLFERLKKMDKKYNVPSYFDENIHFTRIDSNDINFNIKQIVEIVISDVNAGVKSRIIGLEISDFNSAERIKKRSRGGETGGYSKKAISVLTSHYEKLYDLLENHGNLTRMVDIGKLL